MSKKQNEPAEPPIDEPRPQPQREEEQHSIIQPIIDDLKGQTKTRYSSAEELGVPNPPGPGHPRQSPEVDEDAGSGDNPDEAYPQS